ncbi:MAG: hypothetical protein V8R00_07735 [Coprococcus catus]
MTDDSMVDTEKNMSIEIPEGEDTYAYRAIEDIIKERACIEHEEGKASDFNKFDLYSILTIQEAAKRINMTEEVFKDKMRLVERRPLPGGFFIC